MINLFEYQNKYAFEGSYENLELFLDDVWKHREKTPYFREEFSKSIEAQQFLQFIHKTNEIKSNKYVGVIHFAGQKINLLPKIFYAEGRVLSPNEVNAIQNHLLWWLSYCSKIKFPKYQTTLGSMNSGFFEVLIYQFSKYTRELLSNAVYQQYEDIDEELFFIKGRLNANAYIQENLVKGKWHKINCNYDAFVVDNKFNRIIKFVTNLLINNTSNFENKKNLSEILFILDEVSDTRETADECSLISFNPMFGNFEIVRDYCYLFLKNSIAIDYKNDLKLFAFLLPMEYLFEDFILGFIDKEIVGIKALPQSSSVYLDHNESYLLKPDLILESDNSKVIADTKYKIVYQDDTDPQNGILQNDLYQMIAYAIRFKIKDVILLYPETIRSDSIKEGELLIKDEFAQNVDVNIKTYQLPIIDRDLLKMDPPKDGDLNSMFINAKIKLVDRLKEILIPQLIQ